MFSARLKAELNAMLHRIQISTNTCEVTMQVKRAEKATFHIVFSLYIILHNLLCVFQL